MIEYYLETKAIRPDELLGYGWFTFLYERTPEANVTSNPFKDLKGQLSDKAVEQGIQLLEEDNLEGAVRSFDAVENRRACTPEQKEKFCSAYYQFAKIHLNQGSLQEAALYFQRVRELMPNDVLIRRRVEILNRMIERHSPVSRIIDLLRFRELIQRTCVNCQESHTYVDCAKASDFIQPGYRSLARISNVVQYVSLGRYVRGTGVSGNTLSEKIRAFKGGSHPELGEAFGWLLADYIMKRTNFLRAVDIIVPVPPDTEKYAHRGYAPTDILAQHVESETSVPRVKSLVSLSSTAPETEDSYYSGKGTFKADESNIRQLVGKRVLLLDDVATSGGTLSACARCLLYSGAEAIDAITLAKTGR